MKKIKLIIYLFLVLSIHNINSSIGCMEHSYHLSVPCDYKNYHYVGCKCPCTDIIGERGKCRRCYHYGNPVRGEINTLQLEEPDYILR